MKSVKEANLKNKKVLMRAGFDVAIDESGKILDDTRIKEVLPTIKYILEQEPKELIIISHLGRPEGKVVNELKLSSVAVKLGELLRISNLKSQIKNEISNLKFTNYRITDNIFLLENIRFYPEEEKNDPGFAKKLASLGELFIFEAFSAAHREQASTTGIIDFLPTYLGLEMEKELSELSKLFDGVARPYVVIIGGAKTEDKASVIEGLKDEADKILVGGRTANLLCAQGQYQGSDKVILAVDGFNKRKEVITAKDEPLKILDIGSKTIKLFLLELKKAKSILLAGPLGRVEEEPFGAGTKKVYQAVADSASYKVAAGGDTIRVLNQLQLFNKFDFVSTGGGAALEFLVKKTLPVIEKINKY